MTAAAPEVRVWLSLGSNQEPERHLTQAIRALRQGFGELVISPLYRSAAVGFVGDPFLNLVVGLRTRTAPEALVSALRDLEAAAGRRRGAAKYAPRTLDIDILTYGDLVRPEAPQLPHPDILRYAFVLRPLAEVAPEAIHPLEGRTFRRLWQDRQARAQTLEPVAAPWNTDHGSSS